VFAVAEMVEPPRCSRSTPARPVPVLAFAGPSGGAGRVGGFALIRAATARGRLRYIPDLLRVL
jgi:hypothetical protein